MDLVVVRENGSIGGENGGAIARFGIGSEHGVMAVDGALRAAGEVGEESERCARVDGV